MKLSTLFSVSPTFFWGLLKLLWIGIVVTSLWIFLSVFRYRSSNGEVLQLAFRTRATICTIFPVLAVTGFEVASVGTSNGWIFYPNLTYLPLAYYLLIAVVLLHAESLLRKNFKIWIAPISLFLVAIGWGLNLSYEINALSVPFALGVLLLKPVEKKKGCLGGNRTKLVVATIFGGSFATIFLWTRWQLAQIPCVATENCYDGTVVDVQLGTIVNNFVSALPGSEFTRLLSAPKGTLSLSVIIVGLLAASVLVYLAARFTKSLEFSRDDYVAAKHSEQQPLLLIAGSMVVVAIGSAVITGITKGAIPRLATPITPYRSGPVITLALSVALAALLILLWRRLANRHALRKSLMVGFSGLVVLLGSANFVLNTSLMRDAISTPSAVFVNQIFDEVALGAEGKVGDQRRCALLEEYNASTKSTRKAKIIRGAQDSFTLYYGIPFCTRDIEAFVDMDKLDGH
jgi:hypothetical protein